MLAMLKVNAKGSFMSPRPTVKANDKGGAVEDEGQEPDGGKGGVVKDEGRGCTAKDEGKHARVNAKLEMKINVE